jgi:biotin-(acetyl-CoA carboxylase) ligase
MLDDRKLGGILCEARWQGKEPAWIAVGVGLNVTNGLAAELAPGAIRLADRLPGIGPDDLEPQITARLRRLEAAVTRLDTGELAALRARDWLRGRRLHAPAAGHAEGIADDGALLVRSTAGALERVRAGTVELAEPSLAP